MNEPPRWSGATAPRCWPAGGRRGGERAPWGRCGEREWPILGPGSCPLGNEVDTSTRDWPRRYGCQVSDGVASRTVRTTTVRAVSITDDAPVQAPPKPRSAPPRTAAWWWLVAACVLVLVAVAATL